MDAGSSSGRSTWAVSLFAGEAEGRLDEVLPDAADRRLKPIYNILTTCPASKRAGPLPAARGRAGERCGSMASFDAGRGCPFQCSFCTIINVQGRKSRRRSPDDIEEIMRRNVAQGIYRFFITDDNFARNKDWEPILDRVIQLREVEGMEPIGFTIQVDTLCHKIPNFIEKAAAPACQRVFIGLENINPDNLIGGQEAAEQDHRIPHDAARLEAGAASSPMPATSSAFPTTRRNRSCATSRSSSANCRSTFWSSSI